MSDSAPFAFATVGRRASWRPIRRRATDVPLDASIGITFSTSWTPPPWRPPSPCGPPCRIGSAGAVSGSALVPDEPLPAGPPSRRDRCRRARPRRHPARRSPRAGLRARSGRARGGPDAAGGRPEGIAVTTAIDVVFSTPLDPDSVSPRRDDDHPVRGRVAPGDRAPGRRGTRRPRRAAAPVRPVGAAAGEHDLRHHRQPGPASRRMASSSPAWELAWSFTTGSPSATLSNQVVFVSNRGGVANVWAMNPDGTNQRQVSAEVSPVTDYAVAPDGRSLVVGDGAQLVELRGRRARPPRPDRCRRARVRPRVQPDGRSIAFARADATTGGGLGIWQRGVAGGDATQLSTAAPASRRRARGRARRPAPSPSRSCANRRMLPTARRSPTSTPPARWSSSSSTAASARRSPSTPADLRLAAGRGRPAAHRHLAPPAAGSGGGAATLGRDAGAPARSVVRRPPVRVPLGARRRFRDHDDIRRRGTLVRRRRHRPRRLRDRRLGQAVGSGLRGRRRPIGRRTARR